MQKKRKQEIEQRFGMTVNEVIEEMADDGRTLTYCAKAFGYKSIDGLCKYLVSQDMRDVFGNKRSIIDEVEDEYGEPFWDVVRGFASDGYACDTTAGILGYTNPSSFRKLIKREDVTIDWPAPGQCNVHKDRGPHSQSRKDAMSRAKRKANTSAAGDYERRTGEQAIDALNRIASTMNFSEASRFIGWKNAASMRAWMKVRGYEVKFKEYKPMPPRGKGMQSKEMRALAFQR